MADYNLSNTSKYNDILDDLDTVLQNMVDDDIDNLFTSNSLKRSAMKSQPIPLDHWPLMVVDEIEDEVYGDGRVAASTAIIRCYMFVYYQSQAFETKVNQLISLLRQELISTQSVGKKFRITRIIRSTDVPDKYSWIKSETIPVWSVFLEIRVELMGY